MRPHWDDYFLQIALDVAKRATCLRRCYGAVIVKDNRIFSTGYCGAPKGEKSCDEKGVCKREELGVPAGERYELCLHGNTVIKLIDGTKRKIKELVEEGKPVWVYSIEPKTLKIIPALAEPIETGVTKQLIKVKFKKSGSVLVTPEHLFMLRDGSYKMGKDLITGDRIMPIYYNQVNNGGLRESVSNGKACHRSDRWVELCYTPTSDLTQNIVYNYFHPNVVIDKENFIHHKDGNSLNNAPDNLEYISRSKHAKEHNTFSKLSYEQRRLNAKKSAEIQRKRLETDVEFRKKKSEIGHKNMTNNWNDREFRKKMLLINIQNGRERALKTNSDPKAIANRAKSKIIKGVYELSLRSGKTVTVHNYEKLRRQFPIVSKLGDKGNKVPKIETILKWFNSLRDVIKLTNYQNHQIESVEIINYKKGIPIYCLIVPSAENFAVDLGDNSCVIVHNCSSVHGEANAIIWCAPEYMKGATIYVAGFDTKTGELVDGKPCLMCMRMIKNANISKIVYRTKKGGKWYISINQEEDELDEWEA